MKRVYSKPEIKLEKFVMDIPFAGSCGSAEDQDYKDGEAWWNEGNQRPGFDSFEDYWNFITTDDSNSGKCYFTVSASTFS